jgi:TetR/AcrR family tetracycline transcriptional repressor
VLDAALTLMDAGGPAGLSIRRIAAALGVTPNAVYTYFPDKSGIEQALIERLLGEMNRNAPHTGDWRADLETLALDLRARLTGRPGRCPCCSARSPWRSRTCRRPERRHPRPSGSPSAGAAMAQVPAETFPRTAVVDVSSAWIGTDQYLWGLHRVPDGLPTT